MTRPAASKRRGQRPTPWWNFLVPQRTQKPMVAGMPLRMVMISTSRVGVLALQRAQ